ncbi:hypothetical protein LOZ66_003683 [Ophidiomyces ophidiicola]|nr:hypothetical protein LOZ66_003683 [Ophidiomyces ophidiicola]
MTLAANDALPATLKSITDTKLKELSKKQTLFESRKKAIYDEAANQQTLEDKVRILLEGVARVKGFPDDGLDTTDADDAVIRSDGQRVSARHVYYNIRRELVQRKYDSSISDARLRQSEEELRKQLEFISAKHEHALFFNRLVTEWLNNPRNPVPEVPDGKDLGASYKQLERKEVQEQRAQWEKLVFERRQVDGEKIKSYLTNLFHQSSLSEQALKDFRKRIQLSSKQFLTKDDHFTLSSLKWIIGGVISKDILSTDKVAILREFLVNNAVAQEVADVLNVRMAQLDNWSWSSSPIPVEMRRHLNGKYRAYMDEDILDAMFLHYIGVKWSIQFKELFMSLFNSHAWKAQSARIPKQDIERRKYFLYENGREGRDEYNILISPTNDDGDSKSSGIGDDISSVSKSEPIILPNGSIKWGFLKLNETTGRFEVDQSQIDEHIQELRRQLSACKSVFSWVQAWNTYMARFMSNNFGKPALCLGRPHIEMVLSTLRRIEQELFAENTATGGVSNHLRQEIEKKFGITGLPDGFFYLPEEYGGLSLTNPFVSLIAMREGIKTTPERILRSAFIAEQKEYATAKEKYEKQGPNQTSLALAGSSSSVSSLSSTTDFMALEEFFRYSETTSYLMKKAYEVLLEQPSEVPAAFTPELQNVISTNESNKSLPSDWSRLSSYSKGIVELYHPGMLEKYGGLAGVEDKTLPLGVVKILKRERIRWHSSL